MIVMPAIDLREGACVQLVGGAYAEERVRLPDPPAVAARWRRAGFRWLHVVDLDAATGRGSNRGVVRELLAHRGADVQVGGGVRTDEAVDELLAAGAKRVVVGTRALEDPAWVRALARRLPGCIVVAVDVRDRRPVVSGWSAAAPRTLVETLLELEELPLAGVLVTAVHVEGSKRGPDLALVDEVRERIQTPLIASGGVASIDDLRELDRRGAAAAVVGMALYDGTLDGDLVARTFGL